MLLTPFDRILDLPLSYYVIYNAHSHMLIYTLFFVSLPTTTIQRGNLTRLMAPINKHVMKYLSVINQWVISNNMVILV